MSKVNILSPHLDDAALSCFSQIGPDSRVITVFAGIPEIDTPSEWDIRTGFKTSHEAMAQRIEENNIALRGTHAAIVNLGYLENLYRDITSDPANIADTIEGLSSDDDSFVVAAGIGESGRNHPDHIITANVGKELLLRGRDVTFYADLPYMFPDTGLTDWALNASSERLSQMMSIEVEAIPQELTSTQQVKKHAAFIAHASQVEHVAPLASGALRKPEAYRWELLLRPKLLV